jgi:hypothetical protein
MIIAMIRGPIRRLAVTTTAEMTLVSHRLLRQEGVEADVLQGELTGSALLFLLLFV